MTLTFYDAFHGVGGFRHGLEKAGWECVGGCEIDKFACQAYGVINNEDCKPTDIRTVDPVRLPDFDAFVFGWPCQDNSIAGKRGGQIGRDDTNEGNRSGLLYEAARIMRVKKPKYFIAENVEGLFSVNDGLDFYQTIRLFSHLGYDCQWQVLNTRWFLPQNRERIFFVGHLRGSSRPQVFPFESIDYIDGRIENSVKVVGRLDIKGDDYIKRVYSVDGISPCLPTMQGGMQEPKILVVGRVDSDSGQTGLVYSADGIAPTVLKQHGNAVTKILVVKQGHGKEAKWSEREVSTCLDANYYKGLDAHQARTAVYENGRVRKLTPLECFRLQGYPDDWLYKLRKAGISDSQLYKMAGNGVSSPVAEAVGLRF